MTDAEKLAYWKQGAVIIEGCEAKAQRADPYDAPMPLLGRDAAIWHQAQQAAYRHALEMMGPPE